MAFLHDGSPIPPRVHFHDISTEVVEETRPNPALADGASSESTNDNIVVTSHTVFRGNIEWLRDYGTTWQNCERWEYEMHFDSQLTCIISGTVHSIKSSAATSPSSREEMSQYGSNLIYLNAGLHEAFERWLSPSASMNDGDGEERSNETSGSVASQPDVAAEQEPSNPLPSLTPEQYERYTQVSRRVRRRLQTEGASVRTTAMMNRVLTLSQQLGTSSPFDYNLP